MILAPYINLLIKFKEYIEDYLSLKVTQYIGCDKK